MKSFQFDHDFTEIGVRFHQLVSLNEGGYVAPVAFEGFEYYWLESAVVETG